jgi:histidinol dehydrogenase
VRILSNRAAQARVRRLAARGSQFGKVEPQVRKIVDDVRRRGDKALRKYSEQWDSLGSDHRVRVSPREMDEALKTAAPQLTVALRKAAENIRRFAVLQKPKPWQQTHNGVATGQIVRPLDSVGCYVPGGRYPLVSTLLMTVIPAQVAGVKNIRVVSPQPRLEVLAAAAMLGVTEFYRIGGAQAIAALAYGTESVNRVDKIVGPGNLYVTSAKKLVSFDCAIDFLAGPTEVVILSHDGQPEFIAADLVAQAEHDPEAVAILISTSSRLAKSVLKRTQQLSRKNPIAKDSLHRHGVILLAESREQSLAWANEIAPEHITVSRNDVAFIQNAASIFIGDYSAQAAGDYASGPNHVLPTSGIARFRGGLSVMDFVKIITVQELSREGLRRLAPTIEYLAETEGLRAHAGSIQERIRHA